MLLEICGYAEQTDNGFEKCCKELGIAIPQWYKKYNIKSPSEEIQLGKIKGYNSAFLDWLYKLNCTYDGAEILCGIRKYVCLAAD